MKRQFYAQGDIVLERVPDGTSGAKAIASAIDPDNSVVLARGEMTGHRHRFLPNSNVLFFRDDALARDIPSRLYLGHVKIADKGGAELRHEEHETIKLPQGTYRVRRQREFDAGEARIVAD